VLSHTVAVTCRRRDRDNSIEWTSLNYRHAAGKYHNVLQSKLFVTQYEPRKINTENGSAAYIPILITTAAED